MPSRSHRGPAPRAFAVVATFVAGLALAIAPLAATAAAAAAAPATATAPPAAAAPTTATAAPAAASAPRPAAAPAAPPAALDTSPYSFRFVEGAGGVPLNVVTVGDPKNPPILFIHGLGQSWISFEKQFESDLAKQYYLVAFDLRGHGGSGKPWDRAAYQSRETWGEDVDRVVKALQLRRPLVLGWSDGTLVAVDYLRYAGPAAVSGVELVGAYGGLTPPPAPPTNPTPTDIAFAQNRLKQVSPDFRYNYEATRFTVGLLTAHPMPQAWKDRAVAISMMMPRIAREGMFMRAIDSRDLLPALKDLPFLVNVGKKDVSTPEETARELAKQLSNASVSVYDDDGHSPFVESPERFNRELAAFAAKVFAKREAN
jgi:non-heme chloroperoxidase